MKWPIFFREELKIGNLNSSIGICTLWTKKDMIYKKYQKTNIVSVGICILFKE
jgi:hypothetical protein